VLYCHVVKYTLRYPMQHGGDGRLLRPDVMVRLARAAESAGFDGIAFTEHPAPSAKWLDGGGHESLDPLTALAFIASVTERIRLLTYLLVLPYRNPLLAAKQAATVDVLSAGRLTLAVGTGYLRSEFAALGVDFEERNDLFDEAVEVMTGVWRTPSFHHEGRHFTALSQTQRPEPVQRPHPPLWIGGNSRRSRRRAVRFGQGWTPLLIQEERSQTTRTPPLTSPAELASAIRDLHALAAEAGRDPSSLDIQVEWDALDDITDGYQPVADAVGRLAEAGANWVVFEPPAHDADRAVEVVRQYGEAVIRPR
jgi:probable F420-dependent oxidoreductase